MRYLTPFLKRDLEKKMVLLAGPRQSGKTTLALEMLKGVAGRYFNWDADEDRRDLIQKKWKETDRLLIFDEIHKYSRWKNWLKGTFDKEKAKHQILVTGSARLDVYRKGGDSLFGRYHHWRLHPFSLCELPEGISPTEGYRRLMEYGGFPEPFLSNNPEDAKRWRKSRYDLVLKQDVRDLENIRDLGRLTLFLDLLRERVGSPVVLSNLARDLEIAPKTAKHWLELMEKLYFCFVVRPYAGKLSRALTKPPKVYFYDNADVIGDEGARFENLVASHLIKQLNFLEDRHGDTYELCYVRDKEKREVDFVVLKNRKVECLIETKKAAREIPSSLRYFHTMLKPKNSYLYLWELNKPYDREGISVRSAIDELSRFKYV